MRIYLINLDRAPERLQYMQKAFDEAGLEFTRIAAVDGKQLSDEEISCVVSGEGYWGWLTRGEIGCFLSHRLCWQAIADAKEPYAAIFEDDMVLGANTGKILSTTSWIPEDADVVKLETEGSRIYVDKHDASQVAGRAVRRLRSSHYCAGGYILARNAASNLLEQSQTFADGVDHILFSSETVAAGDHKIYHKIYQLIPAICEQERFVASNADDPMFPSSIQGRRQKCRKRMALSERAKLIALREGQSVTNKLLRRLGKRERFAVDFR